MQIKISEKSFSIKSVYIYVDRYSLLMFIQCSWVESDFKYIISNQIIIYFFKVGKKL